MISMWKKWTARKKSTIFIFTGMKRAKPPSWSPSRGMSGCHSWGITISRKKIKERSVRTIDGPAFFVSFAFYLAGLNGTVPSYRDSGDLIASIQTLGIAHPPGYALYVLLGKLFVTLLPFGNIAYRVNVMSALFAAFSISILYAVISKGIKNWAALVVVVLFATSPAVVALARVAEMLLSAFLAAAILYCLLGDFPNGTSYAALLLGLGLSVHIPHLFSRSFYFARHGRRRGCFCWDCRSSFICRCARRSIRC